MAKLTTAQLVDQLTLERDARLLAETERDSAQAECEALHAKINELREFAAKQVAAKIAYRNACNEPQNGSNTSDLKPNPVQFDTYVAYCASAREWHKARKIKVISFASREQFDAAHAA